MTGLKVCHVTSAHTRYDVRIFQKECRSLAEAGFDVTLVVNDEGVDEEIHGVNIKTTGQKPRSRFDRFFSGAKNVYSLASKVDADIYHLHDTELLFYIKPLRKKAHVIFDAHEFTANQILMREYLPRSTRSIISKTYQWFEQRVLPKASAIIVPTTIGGEMYYDRFGVPVILVNNYSLLREMDILENEEREHKGYACYLGSLTHARGLTQMIEAARLSGVPLVLGGNYSPDSVMEELREMEQTGIGTYVGQLNREQVRDVLRHSSIGLNLLQDQGQYPRLDNLSTKVYEYMHVGLPVIMSNFPYANAILEEYPFGISVDPTNPDEIAQAMKFLINNPDKASEMGCIGTKAIHEKFNWEMEVLKLVELYHQLGQRQ